MDIILDAIRNKLLLSNGHQTVVAISGFGGSGKSTLASKIKSAFSNADIISIDSFVVNKLSKRSENWDGFDFGRFMREVLEPASHEEPISYGVYDWKEDAVITFKSVAPKDVLIVEGCGIFQPNLMPYYDYSIWVDVLLGEATRRGIARDRSQGTNWDDKWLTIWQPNEEDFFKKYQPDKQADFIFRP